MKKWLFNTLYQLAYSFYGLKLLTLIVVFYLFLSFIGFAFKMFNESQAYLRVSETMISQVFQQHSKILHYFGKTLRPLALAGDEKAIAHQIQNFENYSLAFEDDKTIVPKSIHWVSVTEPEVVIGAFGRSSRDMLAPDQSYYEQGVTLEQKLIISRPYQSKTLLGLEMIHFGLGVFTEDLHFVGQVDIKYSIKELQTLLKSRNKDSLGLYQFVLLNDNNQVLLSLQNLSQNQSLNWEQLPFVHEYTLYQVFKSMNDFPFKLMVGVDINTFLASYLKQIVLPLLFMLISYFIILSGIYIYCRQILKPKEKSLKQLSSEIDELEEKLKQQKLLYDIEKKAQKKQWHYGQKMARSWQYSLSLLEHRTRLLSSNQLDSQAKEKLIENSLKETETLSLMTVQHPVSNIYIDKLFKDVIDLNLPKAKEKNISINYSNPTNICSVQYNELRLVQIVSGILYELLNQAPEQAHITFSARQDNSHFILIFQDDGYPFEIEQQEPSNDNFFDIRYKKWHLLKELIEHEKGKLVLEHQLYLGNTVTIKLPRYREEIEPVVAND